METSHKKLIPNSTQLPNILLDHLFPFLTDTELRATLYIARRTYGFQKEKDAIGLGQFVDGIVKGDGTVLDHGAGIARTTAMRTLRVLGESGFLEIKRAKAGAKGRKENIYSINLDADIPTVLKKLETLRKDIKGKRARKATLFDTTRVAPDTSSGSDTSKEVASDTSTRVAPDTHKTKSKPSTKQSFYAPGAHRRLIQFFHDTTLKSRGFKPTFSAIDGKRLKDVLALELVPEQDLEKFMLFFIAHHTFKTFTPSLTTFLSAGILNGMRNRILNDPKFYKELDDLAVRYYPSNISKEVPVQDKEKGFERKPIQVRDDEYIPSKLTHMSDHISKLIQRLGLPTTTSG